MNKAIKQRLRASLEHATKRAIELDDMPGFIYIVRCNEFVKIGIAANVERRFYSLQTANPHKLELLKWWPSQTAVKDEKLLHAMFDQFRVRLEWFNLPDDILKVLLGMTDSDLQDLPLLVPKHHKP